MHQEIRLKSVLAIGAALLVSVAGECTNFNFDVDAEPFGVEDPYTNPYPMYGPRFRVTPMLNCTSELAQSQGGNGGNGSTCSFHRYPMGLIGKSLELYPLPLDVDTREHIFSLVQAANPPNITTADFNATIVLNYTTNPIDEPDFHVGETGAYSFNPRLICYNGTLSGCDSSDGLEAARIQACGFEWIDDSQHLLPTGQQQYKGYVNFFPPIHPVNETDPQPTYADAAGNATVNKIGKPTGNSTNSGDDTNTDTGDDTSEAWIKGTNFLALVNLVGLTVMANYL
ncbi:hypothetical protein EKO27_g580 [Xylaria grammica]|uniref:Autophagy-related protein 27 n=1 Tax=Xylaria grammica TaxID=363999 RepID=A0A439DJH0_9PEZI|nr:hypothetical protein EKO27_g580 [Xylaria grammica]